MARSSRSWSSGRTACWSWRLAGGKVTIERLEEVGKKDRAALETDAERVLEFMGHR